MSNILSESYMHISEDTKFIRLTTLTSFIHSVVFTAFVVLNLYRLIHKIQPSLVSNVDIGKLLIEFSNAIPAGYYIIIGLILFI